MSLRYLARGSGRVGAEWRARWEVAKTTGTPVFPGTVSEWDINKVSLTWWSRFYDNIFEHPERPPMEIIEDNKKLDKWIEEQTKKQEEERKKRARKFRGGLKSAFDHDEVIVFGGED